MWFDRLLQGFYRHVFDGGCVVVDCAAGGHSVGGDSGHQPKGGIYEAPALNRALGAFVNLFRSIPFLILMVALIPFTRLIVGTTYGVWAAVVPLTIAATPFFARIAEVSLREVDHGLMKRRRRWAADAGISSGMCCCPSAAGDCRWFHDYVGDDDQLVGHGRGDWGRWVGGHRLSVWVSAV